MKPGNLITSANGHTGCPAPKELLSLGFAVRAFVRNRPNAQELKRLDAEFFAGYIEDIRNARKSLEGLQPAHFVAVETVGEEHRSRPASDEDESDNE